MIFSNTIRRRCENKRCTAIVGNKTGGVNQSIIFDHHHLSHQIVVIDERQLLKVVDLLATLLIGGRIGKKKFNRLVDLLAFYFPNMIIIYRIDSIIPKCKTGSGAKK